ncbi:HPr family phosphocarrier protein [Brevibacillus humidisoli]|uniref:HPr family phosphocarrier protein n=1 Tax=Brevibacillus humidisoli TaxID=2895522 RepID=UPI001E468CA5|nr:HPr family phosphocarrier protein [Brevibacillus humidisoli]UFJ42651.1 HPr family phosphocarrier protein [Brevibacillus humidisoli]
MVARQVTIQNETGLHARPASEFVKAANRFQSAIKIRKDEKTVADGKSILGLMTMALSKGTVITIEAEGADEQQAVDALVQLIESKFGEE